MNIDEESEEATAAKGIKKPIRPSQAEVEQHELTHLPFRDWCEHCVRGRARDEMHKRAVNKEESDKLMASYVYEWQGW